jgi:Cytochrome c554 and c-prime
MENKRAVICIVTIIASVMFLSKCSDKVEKRNDPRGNIYAGSASCRKCHQSIYDAYMSTAHYNTTRTASGKNVLGSFSAGHNIYSYDSITKIVMEHRDSGLFQVLYINGKEQEAHRFDITFGMQHAQTLLYWEGNKTFELPVSYYASVNTWATSPGFSSKDANFKRFIGKNCFECHSSFIDNKLSETSMQVEETLDKNSLITGIDCERCHGPAINHVNYHTSFPEIKEAKYIVNSLSLTRQQRLDVCAVCHSGNDKEKEISTFAFKMGDTLAHFYLPWGSRHGNNPDFDVHGNQSQLLAESKCFLASKTLNCNTCHDPHTNASNDIAVYSMKCLTCHEKVEHPTLDKAMINTVKNNCIGCHMPEQPSQAITFQLAGSNLKSTYPLHTHKIAVYGMPKMK